MDVNFPGEYVIVIIIIIIPVIFVITIVTTIIILDVKIILSRFPSMLEGK